MPTIYFAHDQQESPALRRGHLEMSGFDVVLFESGPDLITAIAREKPDLVLLDVLLDGPHGFDVCRLIRHQYSARELPVILMSTVYRSRIYRDEGEAAGAQGYILMPVQPSELVAEVLRHLDPSSVSAS